MADYVIEGARALVDGALVDADLRLQAGRIAEIGDVSRAGATVIDARGLLALPAMVDIHGDAFERQVMPRPGVFLPLDVALMDTDRQLAGAGIATAYHALTLSWEPGLRSTRRGEAFLDALAAEAPRLAVEHRVQLRWEIFCFEAAPLIARALQAPLTPSIAFNDHTSMGLRPFDMPVTERPFELSADFVAVDLDDPRLRDRIGGLARRAGLSEDAYLSLQAEVWGRRDEVIGRIDEVAQLGRAAGAPMLSHDDATHEGRAFYRDRGAAIAEFPMKQSVARETRARGGAVVLGAPNVLRGKSHIGSLSAADMVEAGLCDVLASDYVYPAMLAAAGRLVAEKRAGFGEIWSCVSAGPARALGLQDRGELAPGRRADVILAQWPDAGAPTTRATFAGGRLAHLSGDLIAGVDARPA